MAVWLAAGALVVAASPADDARRVLQVPAQHPNIQAAVDRATPGDVVLVDEGTYHEEVVVPADHAGGFVIRGATRNGVVLDGRNELGTAIEVLADDVHLENLTARGYTGGGFWWTSVDGFRGRFLTAYRIGIYAIFAFDSANGSLEDSFASGSADASYYVGQCFPCDMVLERLTGEWSAIGYEGTNAGGNLVIQDSTFRNNGVGIMPNSLSGEANPPQRQALIRRNIVADNNNAVAPAAGITGDIVGAGIVISGGNDNVVEDNTVTDHDLFGIVVAPLSESGNVWVPEGNTVRDNDVSGSGLADLVVAAESGQGNCFAGNTFATSDPPAIETRHGCDDPATGGSAEALAELTDRQSANRVRRRVPYHETPIPPPQPEMPGSPFDAESALDDVADSGSANVSTLLVIAAGAALGTGFGLWLRLRRR